MGHVRTRPDHHEPNIINDVGPWDPWRPLASDPPLAFGPLAPISVALAPAAVVVVGVVGGAHAVVVCLLAVLICVAAVVAALMALAAMMSSALTLPLS